MKTNSFTLLLSLLSLASHAQNWTGAVDSDWNNAANWSAMPANGADVVIDPANYTGAAAHPVLATNSVFSPHNIEIINGGEYTLQTGLSVNGNVRVSDAASRLIVASSGALNLTTAGLSGQLLVREGGQLTVNGGNVTLAGQLVCDRGGATSVSGGTLTLGDGLRLSDGNVSGSSRLLQTGGTVVAEGNVLFANSLGAYMPQYELNGGTLTVEGTLLWNGTGSGSGRGYFRAVSGQVFLEGAVQNAAGSTMNLDIELAGPVFLHMEGTAVTTYANDSILMRNGASWIDETTVNWTNGGVLHAETAFFTTDFTTFGGNGHFQLANLTIPAGKQLVHTTTNAPLHISGDLVINGTVFAATDRRVVLNGTTGQLLGGNAALTPTFYHLKVANTGSGILLETPIAVSNEFELATGIVYAEHPHAIYLTNASEIIGGSTTAFVDGHIYKTGNHACTFPVGKAPDRYRPLTISAPASLTTQVGVAYRFEPANPAGPVAAPFAAVSTVEYWELSRTGSSSEFSVAVAWDNAAASGLSDCDAIAFALWHNGTWQFVPSETTGLCSGTYAGSLESVMNLPEIGPLTIGFMGVESVEETAETALLLYPNPLEPNGKLYVSAEEPIAACRVYATDGKMVYSGAPQFESNERQWMQLPPLAAGCYRVELLLTNGRKAMRKLEYTF